MMIRDYRGIRPMKYKISLVKETKTGIRPIEYKLSLVKKIKRSIVVTWVPASHT